MTEALKSCDLHPSSSVDGGRGLVALDCIRILSLGELKDAGGLLAFVAEVSRPGRGEWRKCVGLLTFVILVSLARSGTWNAVNTQLPDYFFHVQVRLR